jgi:anaerobic selenocysteine-containing dehydrogenase
MGFDVPLSFEDMPDLEKISGVSSEVVKMITRNLVASKNPFIFIGYGFQRQWNGGMAVRLIASILAVISKADRFYFDRPYQGVDIDYIRLGGQKPNETSISWTCLSEELLHVHDSVFFVLNANPLNTLPGRKKLIETFEKEDNFVIVHDMFLTETAQTADLIIPAKHYLEFEDVIASFGHPYLGFNEKGLDAPVDAMSNMELARELGRRIGLKDAELYETDRDLINGALRKLNIDYDYIKNVKLVRLPDPQKPTDITWPKMEDVLGTLNRPWEGKYMLLTPVARLRLHSQYDNELFTKPVVEVNVEDAMALGLKDGQSLTLYNDKGNMPVSCHVTDRVPKGVLKMEHGFWEGVERPNVNDLVEPRLQKLGSGSQIMWTFVDISTS